MDAITGLLEEMRGERAPEQRLDWAAEQRRLRRRPDQGGELMARVAVMGAGSWGTGVRDGPVRRRRRRRDVGPRARGRGVDQHHAHQRAVPPGDRPARADAGHRRPRRGPGRRLPGDPGDPGPDPGDEPAGVARPDGARRRGRVADEGHRAGDHAPDERGHRPGRRHPARAGRGRLRARTSPARSPSAHPRPPRSRARTRPRRAGCRTPAPPTTSGPTGPPTSWARRSAARSRT